MGRIMSAGKRLAACGLVIGMTAGLSLSAYALTTKEKLDQAQQEREQTGRVLVIRPSLPPIRRAENNKDRLNAFYRHGYYMAKARWEEIRRFVEEPS